MFYSSAYTGRRTNQRRMVLARHVRITKGNSTAVTIITKDANGYVAADAVLFVPVK